MQQRDPRLDAMEELFGKGQAVRPGMKTEEDLAREYSGRREPEFYSNRERQERPNPGAPSEVQEAEDTAKLSDEELLAEIQGQMITPQGPPLSGKGSPDDDDDDDDEDGGFEGDPNNPDAPSKRDYEMLQRNGGDQAYKDFVDTFGFDALNENRNDPGYVPLPREREPHLDYNQPLGPRTLDLDEIVKQGADLSQRNVDDARGEYGLSDEDIDELVKRKLAPRQPRRRR